MGYLGYIHPLIKDLFEYSNRTDASKLKFYEVSESVDNVQNQNSTYFLDNV